MALCKFWRQGNCRNGDRCTYDHPSQEQRSSNGNRFAPLQNSDNFNTRNSNNGFQSRGQNSGHIAPPAAGTLPFSLEKGAIITDLSTEKPQWILSAYGPGRHAPAQLFGGPEREKSFEELRLLHYMGVASGNPQQAAQQADKLYQDADSQIRNALQNVDGAVNFIVNAEKDHPNRVDICRTSVGVEGGYKPNPLSQGQSNGSLQSNTTGNTPFGAPSQPARASAFGAPSQSTTFSTFGAPSTLGAFGQPSALGQKPNPFGGVAPSFGAPSQLGSSGAFGQPSALGQKPTPFGVPSGTSSNAPAPFSSFVGTATPFSQQPQAASSNCFGTPSQPSASTGFPPSQSNSFGQLSDQNLSPFGNPNPPAQSNPFGAPSPAPNNPFGQQPPQTAPTATNPFGAPSTQQPNPFGSGSVQTTSSNPFGNSQPNPPTTNPFGSQPNGTAKSPFSAPAPIATSTPNAAPFSNPPQSTLNGNAESGQTRSNGSFQHPPLSSYTSSAQDGNKLTMFKGKRVVYHGDDAGFQNALGKWERIWCPKGFPVSHADTEMDGSLYDEATEAAYMHLRQTGSFAGGVMPMLPPKREWCSYDF